VVTPASSGGIGRAGRRAYRPAGGASCPEYVSILAGLLGARLPAARMVLCDLTAVLNSTSVFVWIVLALIWFGLSNAGPA
jgi:ABC-type nitrate/sulfonate/bicarbonate transport system permease component